MKTWRMQAIQYLPPHPGFINGVPPPLTYPLPRLGKRNPGIKTRERRELFTRNRERKGKKG